MLALLFRELDRRDGIAPPAGTGDACPRPHRANFEKRIAEFAAALLRETGTATAGMVRSAGLSGRKDRRQANFRRVDFVDSSARRRDGGT